MIYLSILVTLLFLSFYYDIKGKTKNRDFWYRFILLVFILISGLRWRLGVDTPNYLGDYYHVYPTIDNFSFEDYGVFSSPLFYLLISIIKTFGLRFYVVQIVHATIVNILIFKYFSKHSTYFFTCLFFYAITCYTTYNMEIMRASMGIVVSLFAYDYIIEKKWIKAYILFFIAFLFHPQFIIMFFFPLLFFLRFNKTGVVFLFISFMIGIKLSEYLQEFVSLFGEGETIEDKISTYAESERFGSEIKASILYIFFYHIMPLTYLYLSTLLIKISKPNSSILKFEPLLLLGFAMVMVEINFVIAYRFVDCFKIYFVLFYSELFGSLAVRARMLVPRLSYMRSLLFLYLLLFISLIMTILVKMVKDIDMFHIHPFLRER